MLAILLNYAFFTGCVSFIGNGSGRLESLFFSTAAGLAAVVSLGLYVRRFIGVGSSVVYLLGAAFLMKIGIGVGHFLWLVQPGYFGTTEDPTFLRDYLWFHSFIKFIANWRLEHGYFSLVPIELLLKEQFVKSFPIAYLTSDFYYFAGSHYLNMSVFNTLFSLYTAVVVGMLTVKLTNNRRWAQVAVFLAAFQGFSIVSSIMMRDIVGQFFIVAAVFGMFSFRRRLWPTLIFLPVATALFFSQRVAYALIPVAVLAAHLMLFNKNLRSPELKIALVALATPAVMLLLQSFSVLNNLDNYGQTEGFKDAFGLSYLFYLPFNIPKALIGPFPWVQFFEFKPNTVLHIADHIQSVFNFGLLVFLVPVLWKKIRSLELDIICLSGLLLVGTGIFSAFLNSTYVNIGMVLLIPAVAHVQLRSWFRAFAVVFVAIVVANALYIGAGLHGKGVTNFNY